MRNPLIACFFVVSVLNSYGMHFSVVLAWGGESIVVLVDGGRSHSVAVWKMAMFCIMWCLWSKHNGRFFEDFERSLKDLLHFFLTTLFTWAAA